MKNRFMFAAILSLFVFAVSAVAQDKAVNFSGTWNLDVSKSKLGDHANIESQTLTVTQSEKDIKIETATKRTPPPADAPQGDRPGAGNGSGTTGGGSGRMDGGHKGGGQGRGGFGSPMGGDGTTTYSLDGKETKTEVSGPMGTMPVSLKAKFDDGKLKLTRNSSFSGPMGEVTISAKETWELSTDGKTLTSNVERSSPRGNESTTKIYTKKS